MVKIVGHVHRRLFAPICRGFPHELVVLVVLAAKISANAPRVGEHEQFAEKRAQLAGIFLQVVTPVRSVDRYFVFGVKRKYGGWAGAPKGDKDSRSVWVWASGKSRVKKIAINFANFIYQCLIFNQQRREVNIVCRPIANRWLGFENFEICKNDMNIFFVPEVARRQRDTSAGAKWVPGTVRIRWLGVNNFFQFLKDFQNPFPHCASSEKL